MMQENINPLVGARRIPHTGGVEQKYILSEYGRRLIVEGYDGKSVTIDMLAEKLKVSPRTISRWARELGVSKHAHKKWTEKEEEYIKRYYYKKDVNRIASDLGRTVGSIHQKAKRMELTENVGYNMIDVRMGLGVGYRAINKWINLGWLKGSKKGDSLNDHWDFTEKAIREFIFAHPEEINPRLIDWLWVVDILAGDKGLGRLDKGNYAEGTR